MHDLTNKTWRIQTRQIPLLNGQTLWEACLEAYNPRPLPHWYRLGDTITGHTRESVIAELKSHYCYNLTSLWQTEEWQTEEWQTEETAPDAPRTQNPHKTRNSSKLTWRH